jgi:hypothetical protein
MVGVGHAPQEAVVDETLEPIREHGSGNVEVRLEVAEPPDAEERVADDEQRPSLADDLQHAGQ